MKQYPDDHGGDFGVIVIEHGQKVRDYGSQRSHYGKSEHKGKNGFWVQFGIDEKQCQDDGYGKMVNGNSQGEIVMMAYGKPFQKGVNAQTDEEQPRNMVHFFVSVNVTVFGTFGEKFQNNLEQNSPHNKQSYVVIVTFVNVRQQVHHGKRKQEWTTKCQ